MRRVANRYHPRVEDFLQHAESVRAGSGWEQSFRRERIDRITPVDDGFARRRRRRSATCSSRPVTPGSRSRPSTPSAVHAYEPHDYAPKVAVVGAGMAAATEWLNALAAGSEVVSIRRREPLRRALNVPRAFFSKRGLAAFHAASDERRSATLRELSTPSYPPGAAWDEPVAAAAADGRFTVTERAPDDAQVICATGFRKGWREDALLRSLVETNDLTTHGRWIALAPDSTVPELTDPTRTLSLAGVAGQWAFPAADTIAGAKYAAHGFLRHVCRTR